MFAATMMLVVLDVVMLVLYGSTCDGALWWS